MDLNSKALQIRVTGIVQGVGFRPFVYKLAVGLGLFGVVYNEGSDVLIILQGSEEKQQEFFEKLSSDAPPLSKIISIDKQTIKFKKLDSFQITESRGERKETVYISPDTSICADCAREILDENNKRYMYPFINCTNCGPRFTIIKGVPYDRPLTTMAKFDMCEDCRDEYTNPLNRRYHAQPTCCPDCGPDMLLINFREKRSAASSSGILGLYDLKHKTEIKSFKDIILMSIDLLKAGSIFAVKGIGGYHLICNAMDDAVVKLLRKRKQRDDKPFAVMMKDIETVRHYCEVNKEEEKILTGEKKPIVLLRKKKACEEELSRDISGDNPFIGVMLPYTPVHYLLFMAQEALSVIVATSGNISSEPIAYEEAEAFQKLQDIADYFLVNNRDIFIRTDDSVTRVFHNKEYLIRRARGYAPTPIFVSTAKKDTRVLATGGELKSTFCLSRDREFYISHHIGDLENAETLRAFEEGIDHYKRIFQVEPEILAYDMHPDYLSTKYAKALALQYKYPIQHHQAHIASCMADNSLEGEVIGVAFDGTGYGEDGNIWGGEFFAGGYTGFKRCAHLDYVRLPGGDRAVKEPWRMAVSYLRSISRAAEEYYLERAGALGSNEREMAFLLKMLEKGINSPLTSSAGRFFDAASALIGVRSRINYEGQAAIDLEHIADISSDRPYGFDIDSTASKDGSLIIRQQQILLNMVNDLETGVSKAELSGRFHHTVAEIISEVCLRLKKDTGLNRVALSGGVFQNITLLKLAVNKLEKCGLEVFVHGRVPSNDGGVSLGQAVMAGSLYKKG